MALSRRLGRSVLRLLLLGVAGYYALWGGEYSAFDLLRIEEERQAEEVRLARVRTEVDSLRVLAGRLESDLPTIERVARERFGMIRPGETLYRFVTVDSAATPRAPQPEVP
ncbi:MAG TPA: septum formation initiator family protein [Longimicrobiaceae bacterium]|nr:septum formation initiator family protein [Longimicrobiaceae bacterium]